MTAPVNGFHIPIMILLCGLLTMIAATMPILIEIDRYNKSTYRIVTHKSYRQMKRSKGSRGEYEIYKCLSCFEKQGCRFLFNVYLPKADGTETTEIDVLMIGTDAVYVFESKNYAGKIIGKDTDRMWSQILPAKKAKDRKKQFYNPVLQNKTHCKTLERYLPEGTAVRSFVMFSDNCSIKKVHTTSAETFVGKYNGIIQAVNKMAPNDNASYIDADRIYAALYPYSQTTKAIRSSHIKHIKQIKRHQRYKYTGKAAS